MSGYASKKEAMDALTRTIETGWNSKAPSTDPKDYYMSRLFDAAFYHRGHPYGWGQRTDSEDVVNAFHKVMARNMRPAARERVAEESGAAANHWIAVADGRKPLPEGLSMQDARDLHAAKQERWMLVRNGGRP